MKQDLCKYMEIDLYQLSAYWDDLEKIEVRISRTKEGAPVKIEVWTPDGIGNCTNEGTTLLVPWKRAETHLIEENTAFWVDVRPTLRSGMDLRVPAVQRVMEWSAFEDGNIRDKNSGWIRWNEQTKTVTIL